MQIIIGIIGLGIIVFIHELGHFLAAKYYKVHVVEFAVGMGPKLFSHTYKDTVYSIRILPLGGFCRMKSEHESAIMRDMKGTIPPTKGTLFMLSTRKKAVVLLAGPFANIAWYGILSLILFFANYTTEVLPPYIEPIPDTPAYEAGLLAQDKILSIDDTQIQSFKQLSHVARDKAGETVSVQYSRGASTPHTVIVTLNTTSPIFGAYPFISPTITAITKSSHSEGHAFMVGDTILSVEEIPIHNAIHLNDELIKYKDTSARIQIERHGIPMDITVFVKGTSPISAWGISFETIRVNQWNSFQDFMQSQIIQMITMTTSTFQVIGRLLIPKKRSVSSDDIAGPMRIISLVGSSTITSAQTQGILYSILQFIRISAILSFAIAIMNLLPIPVLDGGQLMFYVFYALRRRQPTYKALTRFHSVGVVIMLLLFAYVMFKDISFFMR